MLLEILLIIFLIFSLTVTILLIYWWKKYGKKLFGLFSGISDFKSKLPSNNQSNGGNNLSNQDLKQAMGMLKDIMGNIPKTNSKFKR